jgi:hypothetical protein
MRNLNEYIARAANKEDDCTGRFWEGRFKSQALLDEKALLTCMAYVDLNPIRANLAKTPETSSHTSIKLRKNTIKNNKIQSKILMPFTEPNQLKSAESIPVSLADYCKLVDYTGRVIRQDKKGSIDDSAMPILQRIGISHGYWLTLTTQFERHFSYAVGAEHSLQNFIKTKRQQKIRGINNARRLFSFN